MKNKPLTAKDSGREQLTNRIRNIVPPQVEAALLRRRGEYTDMVDIFHCIQLDTDQWVGVAGDGAHASYEHFSLKDGVLECSDCGWCSTDMALLEVLTKEVARNCVEGEQPALWRSVDDLLGGVKVRLVDPTSDGTVGEQPATAPN